MMLTTRLDITPVITHRFPAAKYRAAFEIMEAGDCGKIILDWE
jgi:threonine 3-dehydrogenase